MNFGARWDIKDQDDNKLISYSNLETGVVFDCGAVRSDTPLNMLLEFILSEGDAGDLVFVNGNLLQIQKEVRA